MPALVEYQHIHVGAVIMPYKLTNFDEFSSYARSILPTGKKNVSPDVQNFMEDLYKLLIASDRESDQDADLKK